MRLIQEVTFVVMSSRDAEYLSKRTVHPCERSTEDAVKRSQVPIWSGSPLRIIAHCALIRLAGGGMLRIDGKLIEWRLPRFPGGA